MIPPVRCRAWCVGAFVIVATLGLSADGILPGDIEWLRVSQTIGAAVTNANAVAVDADGNVYTAGMVSGAFPGQQAPAISAAFVRKDSTDGVEVWTRQFDTGVLPGDQALGISVDASGVYVAGVVSAALPGQVAHLLDAFVRKYDFAGHEL